jgi:hypothetical protein
MVSNDNGSDRPPLLEVLVMNEDGVMRDQKVVDIGECHRSVILCSSVQIAIRLLILRFFVLNVRANHNCVV